MCLLEPIAPITVTPNILSAEGDHHQTGIHFESLLQAISFMGNGHATTHALPASAYPRGLETSSPSSSVSESSKPNPDGLQKLCSMVTFILGGPMPPTPGLIPLCWEELVDWTDEATSLTKIVYRRRSRNLEMTGASERNGVPSGRLRFVPFVSAHEEDAAKTLASQTYMERAHFYQESVIVAVKEEGKDRVLGLASLFQFCRYFTLIRRLADSQTLVPESSPIADQSGSLVAMQSNLPRPPLAEADASLLEDDALLDRRSTVRQDPLSTETSPLMVETDQIPTACVICMDKPEDCVLSCSHSMCKDCHKRWVRKRLRCPFCRQSFSSVKQAVNTQWDLSVVAVPVEQIRRDIQCLEQKIQQFWRSVRGGERDDTKLASILSDNYIQRPKMIQSSPVDEADGFVVVHELAGIVL